MSALGAACVVWISGLPSSGKSTFARKLSERLRQSAVPHCVLDGDEVRKALHPTPGYGPEARADFYDTLVDLAVLLAGQDLVVLVAATAGLNTYRERARQRAPRYLEVEVSTALEECERRDSKGLYAAARAGRVDDVPGVSAPYERAENPDIVATGGKDEAALAQAQARLGA
ncbi:MAG TPA: adenylyl-sulfate kinase [Polyangiaceae bacterium]|nr:adenylyl-sulfate kinase [Polyangiaceae bacterium]